ncbi:MAG: adenine deaminase, partial [Oscillospiraceae bacterium]
MHNHFCKSPLWEVSKTLAAVAQGTRFADLVLRNATLVNVCTGELQHPISVAVASGRIAYVGEDATHCVG